MTEDWLQPYLQDRMKSGPDVHQAMHINREVSKRLGLRAIEASDRWNAGWRFPKLNVRWTLEVALDCGEGLGPVSEIIDELVNEIIREIGEDHAGLSHLIAVVPSHVLITPSTFEPYIGFRLHYIT